MTSLDALRDLIHHEVERHLASRYTKRIGLVTSYDPTNHAAKVTFQPEGQESGWIPIGRQHVGNGWGIVVGLTPGDGQTTGDHVEIYYHDNDIESGRITGLVHSDVDKPPTVQSGEMLVQHQDGRKVFFDKAGNTIIQHGATSAQTTMNADGTIVHMAAPKKFLYLGDEKVTPGQNPQAVYGFVQTLTGTSNSVKARVS